MTQRLYPRTSANKGETIVDVGVRGGEENVRSAYWSVLLHTPSGTRFTAITSIMASRMQLTLAGVQSPQVMSSTACSQT